MKKDNKIFKIKFCRENKDFWQSYFDMAGVELKEGCYECKIIDGKHKKNDNFTFNCEILDKIE